MPQLLDVYTIVAPGLEEECASELKKLGVSDLLVEHGGISFRGDRELVQRANLMLRTASRVLVRLGTFRCRDFPQLFQRCRDLPWGRYVKKETPLEVAVTTHHSRLIHSGRIAETVCEAVNKALGRTSSEGMVAQRVQVRIEDDLCTVSIDSSGELLHRRGYRSESGAAPLRETLAAGILLKLGWDGSEPLFDPMCGSGSFLIEGALLAAGIPPGIQRDFAFSRWPKFRPGAWQVLKESSRRNCKNPFLSGYDIDNEVLLRAERNAERAGVAERITWQRGDFLVLTAPTTAGLVVSNPPYGERLGKTSDLPGLYRDFGTLLRREFAGWRYAFLCPDKELAQATGLNVQSLCQLSNGGLQVELFTGQIP